LYSRLEDSDSKLPPRIDVPRFYGFTCYSRLCKDFIVGISRASAIFSSSVNSFHSIKKDYFLVSILYSPAIWCSF